MASIQNRSRFVVCVKNNDALTRHFSFDHEDDARVYLLKLRAAGYKPRVTQLEDQILVRIRSRGHPELSSTFASMEEAEQFERRVRDERKQGLFVDYGKSLNTTVADLIRRYMRDELPRKANGDTYAYVYQSMLDDSEGLLERQIAERERQLVETGSSDIRIKATRAPMGCLEWLHKPFISVVPTDIEDWMRSREGDVMPGTIWRQYEMLRTVIRLAIDTWRFPVQQSPTDGVREIDFKNERDRRLVGDEQDRLFEAACALDRERAIETRLWELIDERLELEKLTSSSHRKRRMLALRAELTAEAQATFTPCPRMEAFVSFQLATAARRGESLKLNWAEVDISRQTAYLPETKNGKPRHLALRDDFVELLMKLPKQGPRVFNLTVKTCTTAWRAILVRAGIENLTIHDLRHEAISAVAEAGRFNLLELAAFSGHRDLRMLQRYTHLCMSRMAQELSAARKDGKLKNGRVRFNSDVVKMGDLIQASAEANQERGATSTSVAATEPSAALAISAAHAQPNRSMRKFPCEAAFTPF